MRFMAKMSFQPVIMLLININAFYVLLHTKVVRKDYIMNLYLEPVVGYHLQMIASP